MMELGQIRDYDLYMADLQLEKERKNLDLTSKLCKLAKKHENKAEKPAAKEPEKPAFEADEETRVMLKHLKIDF